MDGEFVRTRITQLRMERRVSEYQMSLDLGMSKGYIQSISSGKALPSLKQLFSICDYFGVTLQTFFDENPGKTRLREDLWQKMDRLDSKDIAVIEGLVDHMLEMKE